MTTARGVVVVGAVILVVGAAASQPSRELGQETREHQAALYAVKRAIFEKQVALLKGSCRDTSAASCPGPLGEPARIELARKTLGVAYAGAGEARLVRLASVAARLRGLELTKEDLADWLAAVHPRWSPAQVQDAVASLPRVHTGVDDARVEDAIARLTRLKGGIPPSEVELELDAAIADVDPAVWLAEEKKKAEEKKEEAEDHFFARLSRKGLSLRHSFSGPNMSKPALFSLLQTRREGTVYSTDLALGYEHPDPKGDWIWTFGVEAHVASRESGSQDSLKSRFGGIFVGDHMWMSAQLKHETDADFDVQKGMLELYATPIGEAAELYGIGAAPPLMDDWPFQLRIQPSLAMDAGYSFDNRGSREEQDEVLRVAARLRGDIFIPAVAEFLRVKDVVLYADNTLRYLPFEDDGELPNFLTAGLNIQFNDYVSLDVTFKDGRDAPLFRDIQTLGASVGIKF